MIENFINYVCHSPTDETSPLFLELNTSAMLLAQGKGISEPDRVVRIYDNNAQLGNTPYVKLSDKGERKRPAIFLGGSYQEKQWVTCECVALGATALSAANRAELLMLAVEGYTQKLKGNLSVVAERLDLGGTGSSEALSYIDIDSVDQQPPVTGQGTEFTATRTTRIELWVFKKRTI